MLGKAEKAGLKVDQFDVAEDAWKIAPRDSFAEFLLGFYAGFNDLASRETVDFTDTIRKA